MRFPEDYYLDFHAHQKLPAENEIVIQSLFLQNDLITISNDKIIFTSGLHPWHADQMSKEEVKKGLENLIDSNSIVAVGETGIDKLKGPDLDIQINIFKEHIKIAEKNNLPLIVHSVKAHNEILKIKKDSGSSVPWIIHHFNGGKQMAGELIENGFYLSLSKHINNENSRLNKYFSELPLEKIFLETDDFNIDIKYLYEYTAQRYNISLKELKKQMMINLKNILNE